MEDLFEDFCADCEFGEHCGACEDCCPEDGMPLVSQREDGEIGSASKSAFVRLMSALSRSRG